MVQTKTPRLSLDCIAQLRPQISGLEEILKMKKKKLVIPVLAIVLFGAWYAFRPERLFVNHRVDEGLPTAKDGSPAQILATGTFHSVLHPTAGTATVYAFADGSRVLRLTNFRTSNGPDVHIYMVAVGDAMDSASVRRAGHIDLGSMKGNIGDQNYTLHSDVDLSKYRVVSVWCKRFSVNFGAASLAPGNHMMSRN
jgi:hypothetical protein